MKNKGFTLIELMIVITIVALLGTIITPRFLKVGDLSKVANVQGNLSTLRTSIEMYNVKTSSYPNLVGREDRLDRVAGDGVKFSDIYGGSSVKETISWTDGNSIKVEDTNEISRGRYLYIPINGILPPDELKQEGAIIGEEDGGWAYMIESGDIRADLPMGTYGDIDIEWSEF